MKNELDLFTKRDEHCSPGKHSITPSSKRVCNASGVVSMLGWFTRQGHWEIQLQRGKSSHGKSGKGHSLDLIQWAKRSQVGKCHKILFYKCYLAVSVQEELEGENEGQGGYLEHFMVMDVNQMYCGHFAVCTNHVVHLKLICYMSLISPPKKKEKQCFAELQGQGDAQLAGSGWCERS